MLANYKKLNKLFSEQVKQNFVNIFFMKNHIRRLSYESKFSPHMRNMGNAAEYFMFLKWKSKILVCLCIFYKKCLGQKLGYYSFY